MPFLLREISPKVSNFISYNGVIKEWKQLNFDGLSRQEQDGLSTLKKFLKLTILKDGEEDPILWKQHKPKEFIVKSSYMVFKEEAKGWLPKDKVWLQSLTPKINNLFCWLSKIGSSL